MEFVTWYTCGIPEKTLEQVPKHPESQISAIEVINSAYYVVSAFLSQKLYLGSLEDGDLIACYSKKSEPSSFCNLPKRNLLLASLEDGSMVAYRTDKLPKLPIIYSTGIGSDEYIEIRNIVINKKDVTSGSDWTIRLWHITRLTLKIVLFCSVLECPEKLVS